MATTKKPPATPDKKPSKARTPAKATGKAAKSKAATAPTKPPKDAPKGQRACTAELANQIISLIEEHDISLSEACRRCETNKGDAWRFIHGDTQLDIRYARAREGRGVMIGERVEAVAIGTLQGKYKPDAARVAIDGFKWAAGRMAPKHFGDRVSHEHAGAGGGPIPLAVFTPAQLANLSDVEIEAIITIAAKLGLELPGVAVPDNEGATPP
jgi:hypothetical protein